jgi:plasmid maintenance system antidote protein VapI
MGMSKRKPKTSKPATVADQLRRAILDYGETPYALAKRAGVSRAALGRFIHGQRGLNLDSTAALCLVLGLELKPIKENG